MPPIQGGTRTADAAHDAWRAGDLDLAEQGAVCYFRDYVYAISLRRCGQPVLHRLDGEGTSRA